MRSGLVQVSLVVSSILLGLALTTLATAQAVCPIKTLNIRSLHGAVVENLSERSPVANVIVEVRSLNGDEPLISSGETDTAGRFEFGTVKKGKYALDFKHDFFANFRVIVKTKGLGNSSKGDSILVLLAHDCFNSDVIKQK